MAEGQLCWENRNLTNSENLKLALAWKPTLSSSILVVYPPSQPRQMDFPLGSFPTQRVSGGVQGQQKIYSIYGISKYKKTKRNLSESDLENEAADFPRFIVIESLEEVCWAKFSLFFVEKVISTRATLKTVKKTRTGNLLVDVDSWRQAENIKNEKISYNKMQSLPTWDSTLSKELSEVRS